MSPGCLNNITKRRKAQGKRSEPNDDECETIAIFDSLTPAYVHIMTEDVSGQAVTGTPAEVEHRCGIDRGSRIFRPSSGACGRVDVNHNVFDIGEGLLHIVVNLLRHCVGLP